MSKKTPFVTKKHLFAATERGDAKALKHYVEKVRISLTSTNRQKQTAAHIATTNENLIILKFLLNADHSVLEYRDISGKTLLHVAVEKGSLETVKYLVDEMGADVSAANEVHSNNTPVHVAAEYGHLPVLRFLVDEKKVDVDTRNEDGETAIFLAAEKPHTDVIRYLAEEAKANLTVTDEKGENVLFVSARVGDLEVPKYLLDTLKIDIDINGKDALGYTLAHTAARFDHLECLRYLVGEKGAEIEIPNKDGWTPLHEAASGGFLEVVEYLLKSGASVESKNKFGKTPLHVAGDKKTKKYLKEVLAKRDRRSVQLFQPRSPALPISGREGATIFDGVAGRLDGAEVRSLGRVESSPPYAQLLPGLLVFANTFTRCRECKTVVSATSIVHDKIDLNTIDAVLGAFGFGD